MTAQPVGDPMNKTVMLIALLLTACGPVDDPPSKSKRVQDSGDAFYRCLNGVTYLVYGHGLTLILDKNSKIVPCEEKP